jgi:UPF0716 protein FxsA
MKLFRYLAILIIVMPIIEIYLFMQMGNWIGYLPSVGLLVLMALLGTYLLRTQSVQTFQQLQQTLRQGDLPTATLLEAILLLLSGVLLLAPGFFTDILGFLCLLPPTRRFLVVIIIHYILPWLMRRHPEYERQVPPSRGGQNTVIEGEFRREP